MKVAIINCPIRTHARANNVPLGPYYIGAAIKMACPDVEIEYIDLNAQRPVPNHPAVVDILKDANADIYMISGLLTTYAWQKELCTIIRGVKPDALIVSGGGLASNVGPQLMDWLDVDVVCMGEGERVAVDIVKRPNECKGKILSYAPPPMEELPDIPWHKVVALEQYIMAPIWGDAARNSSFAPVEMKRSLNLVTSRGCPFACKFCNRDVLGGRNFRAYDASWVARETVSLAERYRLDFMGYTDDNFAASRKRLDAFCDAMIAAAATVVVNWGCHARFDELDAADLLQAMHAAGCRYIGFGGESADADILDSMDKRNDPEQMARVIQLCRDVGIHPNATWMIGWPGETRAQMRETAQFILKHAPENRKMFVATAYPNTGLWDMVEDKVLARYTTLLAYVEELGDASKPVMNYSALPDAEFAEVIGHISNDRIDLI